MSSTNLKQEKISTINITTGKKPAIKLFALFLNIDGKRMDGKRTDIKKSYYVIVHLFILKYSFSKKPNKENEEGLVIAKISPERVLKDHAH